LAAGDLFFVDSTHTLGPAGEATRIILEFLPRLRKDVLIHFHDIVFPYDYTPDILDGAMFFPHESACSTRFSRTILIFWYWLRWQCCTTDSRRSSASYFQLSSRSA